MRVMMLKGVWKRMLLKLMRKRVTKKDRSLKKVKREKSKSRNEIILDSRKTEIPTDDDVVELLEDVSEVKSNNAGIMEKYGNYEIFEEGDSFQYKDVSNTSFTEYDEKVLELVRKSELGWGCTICPYASKSKGHVREHAQEHIEGYSHECKYCDKSFSMKRALRTHERRCKATHGTSI